MALAELLGFHWKINNNLVPVCQQQPVSLLQMSWSIKSSRSKPLEGLGKRKNSLKANTMLKCVFFRQDSLSPAHPLPSIPEPRAWSSQPGAGTHQSSGQQCPSTGPCPAPNLCSRPAAPQGSCFSPVHAQDTPRRLEICDVSLPVVAAGAATREKIFI